MCIFFNVVRKLKKSEYSGLHGVNPNFIHEKCQCGCESSSDVHSVGLWQPCLSLCVRSVVGVVFAVSSRPGPVKPCTEMISLKFLNQDGQWSPRFMAMLGRDRPLRAE